MLFLPIVFAEIIGLCYHAAWDSRGVIRMTAGAINEVQHLQPTCLFTREPRPYSLVYKESNGLVQISNGCANMACLSLQTAQVQRNTKRKAACHLGTSTHPTYNPIGFGHPGSPEGASATAAQAAGVRAARPGSTHPSGPPLPCPPPAAHQPQALLPCIQPSMFR